MANPRPFTVTPALTAIAIGYQNRAMIAEDVLPSIPVPAESYKFTRYPLGETFTVPDTRVGRRGRVQRVEFSGVEDTGSTNDYGLEDGVPISDINQAAAMRAAGVSVYDPVARSTMGLTEITVLDREIRSAVVVQDPNNYSPVSRLALSGPDQFDQDTSKPIDIFQEMFGSTRIYRPNTMSMGRAVWTKLSRNKSLVKACKGSLTGEGIITTDDFVNLFRGEGLTKLVIGEAFVNAARPGQAVNLQRVWGNSIQCTYLNASLPSVQGGVTWGWRATFGGRIAGSWDDRNVGLEGGQVVRVGEKSEERCVAPDVGFIIQTPVAA